MLTDNSRLINDKYLIIHADDLGISSAQNEATFRGIREGFINSASVIVPSPWFLDVINLYEKYDNLDIGIHLTLTSEWHFYKIRPILGAEKVSSLVDKYGYFHQTRDLFAKNAKPNEIYSELCAQIDFAISSGIKPTHIDSHMFTLLLRDDFFEIYQGLSFEYGLPILISNQLLDQYELSHAHNKECMKVDSVVMANMESFEIGLSSFYKKSIEEIAYGINVFLIHPAFYGNEMKKITIDKPNFGALWRQHDFDFFTSQECSDSLKKIK